MLRVAELDVGPPDFKATPPLENWHHLLMSNWTQFELNYLCDSALIIYVNLQLLFLTVYLNHFWTWKWRHDGTETSFDFTSVDFYLFLYNTSINTRLFPYQQFNVPVTNLFSIFLIGKFFEKMWLSSSNGPGFSLLMDELVTLASNWIYGCYGDWMKSWGSISWLQ